MNCSYSQRQLMESVGDFVTQRDCVPCNIFPKKLQGAVDYLAKHVLRSCHVSKNVFQINGT